MPDRAECFGIDKLGIHLLSAPRLDEGAGSGSEERAVEACLGSASVDLIREQVAEDGLQAARAVGIGELRRSKDRRSQSARREGMCDEHVLVGGKGRKAASGDPDASVPLQPAASPVEVTWLMRRVRRPDAVEGLLCSRVEPLKTQRAATLEDDTTHAPRRSGQSEAKYIPRRGSGAA